MTVNARYTGAEIAQSQFYQLPKFLMQGEYSKLSSDSKILYALLKDRHSLSMSNGWANDKGEIYLIFSRDEMAGLLGRGSQSTVRKAISQLKAVGLIEEERQGLNKPNLIYLCKPAYNPGLSKSDGQDSQIVTPNETELNQTDALEYKNIVIGDTSGTALCDFSFEKHDNVFNRITESYGHERAVYMLSVVDWYINKAYPARTGRKHPAESKPKRMVFAEKLLACADTTMLEDDYITRALSRAINNFKNGDPTIYWITAPTVLGYWLIQDEEIGYESVNQTEYAPVEAVY